MFVFDREQYIHNIGGVRVGGSPGEIPTVLAGTIFYSGDRLVTNPDSGEFDRAAAETMIRNQDDLSEMTGNPAMVQIFAESSAAMTRYIDFVTEKTSAPFLIDSTDAMVRVAGLRHAEEVGVLDRSVYNSINVSATPEELKRIGEVQPESAIVLAFNAKDSSVAGRRAVLEGSPSDANGGLLKLCTDLGITKPLVDTATTALGAGAGSSVSFVFVAKCLYGQPAGSGIHNAPASWPWLRKYRKTNRAAYEACDISSGLLIHSMGANFILYGPISSADRVFPVIAMADTFAAESMREEFGVEPAENHPFRKLL